VVILGLNLFFLYQLEDKNYAEDKMKWGTSVEQVWVVSPKEYHNIFFKCVDRNGDTEKNGFVTATILGTTEKRIGCCNQKFCCSNHTFC